MLRSLAPIVVNPILNRASRLQSDLGFRLGFCDLPPQWIQGNAMVDMTKTWKRYGLAIRGLNYFTLGAIKDGASTRFNEQERLFQAWLGGYLFEGDNVAEWGPLEYVKLAEADQKKWLWYYGVGSARMEFKMESTAKGLRHSGFDSQFFSWSGITQSDIGNHSGSLRNRATQDGLAYIINTLNKNLSVQGNNFIPTRVVTEDYKRIQLFGCMVIVHIHPSKKALLYVCMTSDDVSEQNEMSDLILHHVMVSKV